MYSWSIMYCCELRKVTFAQRYCSSVYSDMRFKNIFRFCFLFFKEKSVILQIGISWAHITVFCACLLTRK